MVYQFYCSTWLWSVLWLLSHPCCWHNYKILTSPRVPLTTSIWAPRISTITFWSLALAWFIFVYDESDNSIFKCKAVSRKKCHYISQGVNNEVMEWWWINLNVISYRGEYTSNGLHCTVSTRLCKNVKLELKFNSYKHLIGHEKTRKWNKCY